MFQLHLVIWKVKEYIWQDFKLYNIFFKSHNYTVINHIIAAQGFCHTGTGGLVTRQKWGPIHGVEDQNNFYISNDPCNINLQILIRLWHFESQRTSKREGTRWGQVDPGCAATGGDELLCHVAPRNEMICNIFTPLFYIIVQISSLKYPILLL